MNDPEVSPYDTDYHNACDFSNWQAADGAWQLVACIRSTSHPGSTRLFYHWEGKRLTDPMWEPKEIFATSDLKIGYVEGRMPITAKFGWGSYNLFWISSLQREVWEFGGV